ncbi:hypothetical protein ACC771_20715, partial [Rhizobium ruizarguesonis]
MSPRSTGLFFEQLRTQKPLHTFVGIALVSAQFRTKNRYTLLLELLKSDPDPPIIPVLWKTSWPISSACY